MVEYIRPKKILNCFSGHFFFLKNRCGRAGFYFIFYSAVQQMRELYFETWNDIFLIVGFDGYFIGFYSSQAIKLDSESICTLSRLDFITECLI